MNVAKHIRLFRSAGWRYAHQSDMPTFRDYVFLILILLLMSGGAFGLDTYLLRLQAKEAIDTTSRVIGCLNGQRTLGEYTEQDGSKWAVICETKEVRINKTIKGKS